MALETDTDAIAQIAIDDYAESEEFPFKEGITDVTFRVKNTLLHVNKGTMIVASPVFRKMLMCDPKAKQWNVVLLPNKEEHGITLFLKCVYPDQKRDLHR